MTQTVIYWCNDNQHTLTVPSAKEEVFQGVYWGDASTLFTPAYWLSQFLMGGLDTMTESYYTSRKSLEEEVVFCMLGGFGITAEHATAAYKACSDIGMISNLEPEEKVWIDHLKKPIEVGDSFKKYRFPNQKGKYIAAAMQYLRDHSLDELSGREIRDELLNITGVGYKTAGWVARNYTDSDDVAILDIHIIRACTLCGIYSKDHSVERDYLEMERLFLAFCKKLNVRPAVMDCLIWDQMRYLGTTAIRAYKYMLQEADIRQKRKVLPELENQLDFFYKPLMS